MILVCAPMDVRAMSMTRRRLPARQDVQSAYAHCTRSTHDRRASCAGESLRHGVRLGLGRGLQAALVWDGSRNDWTTVRPNAGQAVLLARRERVEVDLQTLWSPPHGEAHQPAVPPGVSQHRDRTAGAAIAIGELGEHGCCVRAHELRFRWSPVRIAVA